MSGCIFAATLVRVEGGGTVDPDPGRITAAEEGGRVRIRTYDSSGAVSAQPFHMIAIC